MFTFIDLFCGIGGFRLAAESVGGKCVFSSDIDKYARLTYLEKFNDPPSGDITQIPCKEIAKHDLLLAGFPCQPFSSAGKRKGFEDTRGTLFFEIARIAAYHLPKVLVLENVRGLVSHDKGKTLEIIIKSLEEIGYKVNWQLLDARDFDLPQSRIRVFIVATLDKVEFTYPKGDVLKRKVGDILEDNVDGKYYLDEAQVDYLNKRSLKGFGMNELDQDSIYSYTIHGRNPLGGARPNIVGKLDNNPRKLTPREWARLQGFPDSHIFPVSDPQAYKQIGNAVPPPIVQAILEELIKQGFLS